MYQLKKGYLLCAFYFLDSPVVSDNNQQQFDPTQVQQLQQQQQHVQPSQTSPADGTFRQPLPPGTVRPRLPVQQSNLLIRNQIGKLLFYS